MPCLMLKCKNIEDTTIAYKTTHKTLNSLRLILNKLVQKVTVTRKTCHIILTMNRPVLASTHKCRVLGRKAANTNVFGSDGLGFEQTTPHSDRTCYHKTTEAVLKTLRRRKRQYKKVITLFFFTFIVRFIFSIGYTKLVYIIYNATSFHLFSKLLSFAFCFVNLIQTLIIYVLL